MKMMRLSQLPPPTQQQFHNPFFPFWACAQTNKVEIWECAWQRHGGWWQIGPAEPHCSLRCPDVEVCQGLAACCGSPVSICPLLLLTEMRFPFVTSQFVVVSLCVYVACGSEGVVNEASLSLASSVCPYVHIPSDVSLQYFSPQHWRAFAVRVWRRLIKELL